MENWLDKYKEEVPKAQKGVKIKDERLQGKTVIDNTRTLKPLKTNLKKINVRNKTDKEIAQERQVNIDSSNNVRRSNTELGWRKRLAEETKATGDKLRVSLEPNFFDDYLNPASMIGDMTSNLGQAPLQAEQSNSIMPYVTSVGMPLVAGALAGIGAQNSGQFVNNLVNPFAGTGDLMKAGITKLGYKQIEVPKNNFQSEINPVEMRMMEESLPQDFLTKLKNKKDAMQAVENAKKDLLDPETIRRAENLGVNPEIFEQASKNMTYSTNPSPSSYNGTGLEINVNPNQIGIDRKKEMMNEIMGTKSQSFTGDEIAAHEVGHFFQDRSYWNQPYPKTMEKNQQVMFRMSKDASPEDYEKTKGYFNNYSTRNTAPTKIDEMLGKLKIRKDLDYQGQVNKNYFTDANKNYGTDIDNMIERFPMFREYRQGMRDSNVLKNKWDEITPEMINDYNKIKPDNRLNSFMEFDEDNYKLLNRVGKIAPAVLPIGLGLGAATQMQGQEVPQQKNGGWLSKYEDGGDIPKAQTGEVVPKTQNNNVNLSDLTYTIADLEFMNNPVNEYCVSGNCLESGRKAFDKLPASIKGIPTSSKDYENMGIQSMVGAPSKEQIKKYPYFLGDTKTSALDSWDAQGKISTSGGVTIYKKGDKKLDLSQTTPGTLYSWGPEGSDNVKHPERNLGLSKKMGFEPSNHTTEQMGFNEKGEPILYDSYLGKYGTYDEVSKSLKEKLGYELEAVGVSPTYKSLTKNKLSQMGILENLTTPYERDISKIENLTKAEWASISEGGKKRFARYDSDKMTSFYKALSENKESLINALNMKSSDYDNLADMALAIAMNETEGGGALNFVDRFGTTRGMTQLNPNNIKDDTRFLQALKKLKISDNQISDLENPKNSAISTMIYLSLASGDSERAFKKGMKPGERTFEKSSGIKSLIRESGSKYNSEGIYIEEINKRVSVEEFEKLPKKLKDNYKLDGDKLIVKTKGNNPNLSFSEKMAYFWQSPNSLVTGDAQGKSTYAKRLNNYYENIKTFKNKKIASTNNSSNIKKLEQGEYLNKYEDGGEIEIDPPKKVTVMRKDVKKYKPIDFLNLNKPNVNDAFNPGLQESLYNRQAGDSIYIPGRINQENGPELIPTSDSLKNLITTKDPAAQKSAQGFQDWYTNPETIRRFGNNTNMDPDRLQDFVAKGLKASIKKVGIDALGKNSFGTYNDEKASGIKSGQILYRDDNNSGGKMNPQEVNSIIQHELVHGSKLDSVLGEKLREITGFASDQKGKGWAPGRTDYMSNPQESYGNFHGLRIKMGLQPGQKINQAILSKIIKDKKLEDDNFYQTYDDENIIKAINTMAYNDSSKYNNIDSAKNGNVIKDDEGYRNPDNWGKDVEIDQSSPNSFIDMTDVYEPLKAIADTGEQRIMYPGEQHKFKGAKKVLEKPLRKGRNGLRQEQKSLQNLNQLTNFTNYNKKQPGGWLDKHN